MLSAHFSNDYLINCNKRYKITIGKYTKEIEQVEGFTSAKFLTACGKGAFGLIDSQSVFTVRVNQSVRKGFSVLDSRGEIRYMIRKKISFFGKRYDVSDHMENEVAQIRQCFALVLPRYRIIPENGIPFTVRRRFSLQPSYKLSETDWILEGDVPGRRFRATDATGRIVFQIEKKSNSWPDKYTICITEKSACLSSVCIAIAMDAADEDIRNARKG